MSRNEKVYRVITDKVIELLERGVVPWRKPWVNGPATRSYKGREYRGINLLTLSAEAGLRGLQGCWITFRQVQQAGGRVKKGARGVPVVFWKWIDREDDDGESAGRSFPVCRYYRVFSLCQTEGVPEPAWLSKRLSPRDRFDSVMAAEAIVSGYRNGPDIRHGGDRAAYFHDSDLVTMPGRRQFTSAEGYYWTLFHELAHSTGHESRLGRFTSCAHVPFGSASYSREELVAEMGAAFLAAEAGLGSREGLENAAAYIGSWIRVLRNEPRMVVVAAAQAQKAADHILGRSYGDSETPAEDAPAAARPA